MRDKTPEALPEPPQQPVAFQAWPIWALAVGQTLGFSCLFYLFAALILDMEAATGWSKASLASGPTLSILVSATLAPLAGRLVDRGLGPELLAAGPVLGAAALAALASGATLAAYLAAWAAIGVAHAACLYEVCFAFLIRRFGLAARPAIIRVTLIAGFASTLAFPAGRALAAMLGWQGAIWVAAGVMVAVVAPVNLAAAGALRRSTPRPTSGTPAAVAPGRIRAALADPGFWLLAFLFGAISLNHWMLIAFLVPVLVEQGIAHGTAVLAASLIGPAQVVGRLVLMRFESRLGTARTTRWTLLTLLAAAVLLLASGLAPPLVFLFALAQGAALGILTILRPMLVAETLGQASYGAIAGFLSIPTLVATAAAPLAGALLLDIGGAALMVGVALALAVLALVGAAAITRRDRRRG